ncbi:MAG TPA: MFS transporter [Kineosporiaceae bacterium]|nr:MFS transporter [Kineosporiaceae bacterium]
MTRSRPPLWLAILAASVPMFMVALDNLVVSTALTAIRADLGSTLEQLQWVVNAYILGFAGALMTGAALGDRFGRRRVFLLGIALFTVASALCGLAQSSTWLVLLRGLQGLGAAGVMPLSLTLLSEAVPDKMRSASVGIWSGISGLAIALGPLVGGLVVDGLDWRWIFWVNVPIGILAIPLARYSLAESRGPAGRLDLPGVFLVSSGVVALVWGIVRAADHGWTSTPVLSAFAAGVTLLIAFLLRERATSEPLLPLYFYRSRSFALTNVVSLAMNFGVFGAIFLLAQFLQFAQGLTALEAGVRTLAWTLVPMVFAPLAGLFTDRIGGGRLMAAGLFLQAFGLGWIVTVADVSSPFTAILAPMMIAGAGMGLVFAPASAVVLASVGEHDRGRASGANTTLREIGGALGVAVLGTVFAHAGSYRSPESFVDGMRPAIWVGIAVVVIGGLAGLGIPRHPKPVLADQPTETPDRELVPAAPVSSH